VPDVAVLDDPAAAVAALDPVRARLLALLAAAPASAAGLATAIGLPRQKVRYHLAALAERGLVVEVDQRKHGGLTERIFAASAGSYVVSPAALGDAGADPARVGDRLSASYLVALSARAVREVQPTMPTLSIDADVRFASPDDRAAFAEELAAAVRGLAAKYHRESAPDGRWYRVVALSYPRPPLED
jgi:DNA-binding transcriptional ArsR family regulator